MSTLNSSFATPLSSASFANLGAPATGLLGRISDTFTPWTALLTLLLLCVGYDQISYQIQKGPLPGNTLKIPFIGPFLESVFPKFEAYHAKWKSGELSCVSVFHKFVVIASTRDMARKVFNSPSYVKPCVVDVAWKLLRPTNWVFLDGKAHVDYRKGLNGLFTRQALSIYLQGQEEVYNKYLAKFLRISQEEMNGQPTPFMTHFRELQCAVSCRTFVGHYMDEQTVKKIADDYYMITAALELVNFPIIIPYTKTWYGKKAADMVLDEFAKCAAKAKVRMATSAEPNCILDAWVKQMYDSKSYNERIAAGEKVDVSEKPPQVLRMFTDWEISQTLMTFLFASQDATSSACTWLFQLMADRPEWLERVREENLKVRNGDRNAAMTMEMLENMPITRAVVKETLRYRPPVLMVPYLVKKDFPVSESYTAKKGTMIVPTTYPALHDAEAYPNPDYYDPERWISGTADQQVKNWLVFGTGPHYCLGQQYAQYNLMASIGKASLQLDWKHEVTPLSEQIKVFATIFPQDDLLLTFTARP